MTRSVHEAVIQFRVDKDIKEAQEFMENEMDLDKLDGVEEEEWHQLTDVAMQEALYEEYVAEEVREEVKQDPRKEMRRRRLEEVGGKAKDEENPKEMKERKVKVVEKAMMGMMASRHANSEKLKASEERYRRNPRRTRGSPSKWRRKWRCGKWRRWSGRHSGG